MNKFTCPDCKEVSEDRRVVEFHKATCPSGGFRFHGKPNIDAAAVVQSFYPTKRVRLVGEGGVEIDAVVVATATDFEDDDATQTEKADVTITVKVQMVALRAQRGKPR